MSPSKPIQVNNQCFHAIDSDNDHDDNISYLTQKSMTYTVPDSDMESMNSAKCTILPIDPVSFARLVVSFGIKTKDSSFDLDSDDSFEMSFHVEEDLSTSMETDNNPTPFPLFESDIGNSLDSEDDMKL